MITISEYFLAMNVQHTRRLFVKDHVRATDSRHPNFCNQDFASTLGQYLLQGQKSAQLKSNNL